jgi:hypothetical protein
MSILTCVEMFAEKYYNIKSPYTHAIVAWRDKKIHSHVHFLGLLLHLHESSKLSIVLCNLHLLFEVDNGAWVTQITCYFIFLLITTLGSLKF